MDPPDMPSRQQGGLVTTADLAITARLVFAWGILSARLERFDMTAPIVFTAAGVLLAHGPLRPLGVTQRGAGQGAGRGHARPGAVLRRFPRRPAPSAGRSGLVPPAAGYRAAADDRPGDLAGPSPARRDRHLDRAAGRRRARADRRRSRRRHDGQSGGAGPDPAADQHGERAQRWHCHAGGAGGDRWHGGRRPFGGIPARARRWWNCCSGWSSVRLSAAPAAG